MRGHLLAVIALTALTTPLAAADENDIVGTYRLISESRKVVETGEMIAVLQPAGYITYGSDNRMLVVIVRNPRPKPVSTEKMTNDERTELFRTMAAYGGTYQFDGSTMVHNIDISWNELWTGTKQIRYVKRENGRLVYTTPPYPYSFDGRISVNTLVWEKVK
jgi:hypothetical protein